jgi:FixJ family two-component response regulator
LSYIKAEAAVSGLLGMVPPFYLPVPGTAPMPAESAPKQRVFVIDDDPAVLSSLKFSLEIEGLSVSCYRSGTELLQTAEALKSGCLVIDYHLFDMTGLDLLRKLRESGATIPALIITSYPSAIIREQAAAAGAQIVEKPLFGNLLLDAIRGALARQATMPS